MNKELFEKFEQGIKENKNSFIFFIKNRTYIVTVTEVFKAKYVYSEYFYSNDEAIESFINGLRKTYSYNFTMIVKDDNYYIVDEYMFSTHPDNGEQLPSNVKMLSDIIAEYNEQLNDAVKEYYDNINPVSDFTETTIERLKNEARYCQIYGKKPLDNIMSYEKKIELSKNNILSDICGYNPIENSIKNLIAKNEKRLLGIKSKTVYIENLIANNENIENWEKDIADGLSSIKDTAKTVNVTFKINNTTATEKMEIPRLLNCLNNRTELDAYCFYNGASAKKTLNELGVGYYYNKDNVILTTEHIIKITYGKKVIFER
jgi:uncharacterized UPF0160 family protein